MISVDEFVSLRCSNLTIDVRTSEEYSSGHIPNSFNIPLLNEEERAEIGILYKQAGGQRARERGLEIVGPKLSSIYQSALSLREQNNATEVIIYCWRGGLRSRFVASILNFMDLKCRQLEGGYKYYRRWVLSRFELFKPEDLLVIDGFTGCGKTRLLHGLTKDYPVIDLEALASHKGSVFGDITEPPQPTQQQFENSLAQALFNIGKNRPIVLEGESQRIGFLQIPKPFFETMDKARRLLIEETLEKRIDNIYEEYIKSTPKTALSERVLRLEKHLGRERCKELIAKIDSGERRDFIRQILVEYYDKLYMKSYIRRQGSGQQVHHLRNDNMVISDWLRENYQWSDLQSL